MKQLILFGLLLVHLSIFGQGTIQLEDKEFTYKAGRIETVDAFLDAFPSIKKLSSSEREVFYWVNVLRQNPQKFLEDYLRPFLVQFPEAKGGSASSLIKDLKKQQPLQMLAPQSNLLKASRAHAQDLVRQNKISHSSSDGKSFRQRMELAGITTCAGENILEGKSEALMAIILLLIDEGVPDKGHRKALLNSRFDLLGCSVYPKTDGENHFLVQIFSCK